MHKNIQIFIEQHIDLLEKGQFAEFFYLSYRAHLNNVDVFELREVLNTSEVCSMTTSLEVCSKLFVRLFQDLIINNPFEYKYIESLYDLLYKNDSPFINHFGLTYPEIVDILHNNASKFGIQITTEVDGDSCIIIM